RRRRVEPPTKTWRPRSSRSRKVKPRLSSRCERPRYPEGSAAVGAAGRAFADHDRLALFPDLLEDLREGLGWLSARYGVLPLEDEERHAAGAVRRGLALVGAHLLGERIGLHHRDGAADVEAGFPGDGGERGLVTDRAPLVHVGREEPLLLLGGAL